MKTESPKWGNWTFHVRKNKGVSPVRFAFGLIYTAAARRALEIQFRCCDMFVIIDSPFPGQSSPKAATNIATVDIDIAVFPSPRSKLGLYVVTRKNQEKRSTFLALRDLMWVMHRDSRGLGEIVSIEN